MRHLVKVAILISMLVPGLALAAPKLELKPCTSPSDAPPEARCGTYEVWENRAAKSGRKIPLRVLVLPALGPDRLSDPFIYFNGGPGDSAVDVASWIPEELAKIRQQRDILLVDFRGTGGSGGLFCSEMNSSGGLQGFLDHFLAPDAVRACAERLSKTADLSQYTNDTSVDDVDEVRAALGYDKLNIYGGSGGTRSALVYARRHPDRVRTLILGGLVPPDERGPFPMARHAQRALDGLIAECQEDPECRAAFPRLREELAAVLRRAEQDPITVTLKDQEPEASGEPVEVRMTRGAVVQSLRYLLYTPGNAARLPLYVHRAAQGDWKPLAEFARSSISGLSSFAHGYYLSLTCAEDLPFIREDEIPAAIQGTFLGDFRIRKQREACAAWPVRPVGREFLEPVTSDVPALLISGERDPVTPPGNAERAAQTLKNSVHVVVPDGGHGFDGIEGAECVDELIVRFIKAGTVKGLDTSCGTRTKRPAFVLEPPHPSRERLRSCKIPGEKEQQINALCGEYEVWENRESKTGRKIRLRVAVLPALSPKPLPDPVFYFSGGPGTAASRAAGYYAGLAPRQERDLVFVDQRGTGEPNRLGCTMATKEDDLQSRLGEMFPPEAVRRCRDELGQKYDLTRYSSADAVDDFNDVRRWLGYDKINVIGSSYGTRTAQVYLRRHPESVRTVTLWGVVPMDEPLSLSHAANGQRALDLTFGWCEEDAACRAKFPHVRRDFQAVMDRLAQGPVEVEVDPPGEEKKPPVRVRLSKEVVADGIRLLLYSNENGQLVLPLLLRQAAAGDWKPLGQAAVASKAGLDNAIARGEFFSVTCAEDIPFIDPAEVPARTAGSFLGDYRVRQQTAACALWPRAAFDPKEREAVRSGLPVLLINGESDPVTPPDFGRRAAVSLTQGLHLVIPYAGHEDSNPCIEGIGDEFLRRGSTQGLDTSCLREVKRKPFLLEMPEEGVSPFG